MALSFKLTIEIPILLIIFCFMLSGFVTTNFVIYRTCYVTFGFNKTDCALLGTDNVSTEIQELEKKVQTVASTILMSGTLIDITISALFSLIIGPWSNKHGRKPVLISTFSGYFFAFTSVIIINMLEWISPWWWIITCLLTALGGGFCSMFTVVFCYIAETTAEDQRGIRMGIIQACYSLGTLVGTLSSSFIFNKVGYIGIYGICATISLLSIIYVFFIPESVQNIQQENKLRDLGDYSAIVKSVKTCFKRRYNMDRLLLGLIMSFLIINIFVMYSDAGIFFLYVRQKFKWSLKQCTLFSSTLSSADILISMFILLILHKYLKIKDMNIIFAGFIALLVSSVIYALANTDWLIYLGAAMKPLSSAIGPLGRSAISILLPPDDLGHVFAVISSMETIVQVISSPLYTLLYKATIDTFPSVYNYLSASIYFINIIITSAVIYIRRYYPNEEIQDINNPKTPLTTDDCTKTLMSGDSKALLS